MSRKGPVLPVRPAGRPRIAVAAGDLEATRIASVDPRTGSEIRVPAAAAGVASAPRADPDATVIGAVPAPPAAGRPHTAEIVPPRDARLSSEVTAAWTGDSSRTAGRFVRRVLLRHRRIAVVSSAAVATVAFAASVLATGRDAIPRREAAAPPPPAVAAPPPAPGSGTAAAPGPLAPLAAIPIEDAEALSARAAGALADGRLEEARTAYASLAAAEPARREWSLALEILGGSGGAR